MSGITRGLNDFSAQGRPKVRLTFDPGYTAVYRVMIDEVTDRNNDYVYGSVCIVSNPFRVRQFRFTDEEMWEISTGGLDGRRVNNALPRPDDPGLWDFLKLRTIMASVVLLLFAAPFLTCAALQGGASGARLCVSSSSFAWLPLLSTDADDEISRNSKSVRECTFDR